MTGAPPPTAGPGHTGPVPARRLVRLRLIAALAAGAASAGCPASRPAAPASGPALRLVLPALDGGEVDTARYQGRVVVLHLFHTASGPAQRDVDQLKALHHHEPDRVQIIGIDLDRAGTPAALAWRHVLGLRYLLAVAPAAMRQGKSPLGQIRVVPTTVVLDIHGAVVRRIERPLQPGELDRLVAPLLPPARPR